MLQLKSVFINQIIKDYRSGSYLPPRFSLKPLNHPRSRFFSYSVMPILLSLLVGLFILTACEEEETAAPRKDNPPSITPIEDQTVQAGGDPITVRIVAFDPDPDQTPTITYSPELPYARLSSTGVATADLVFDPGHNVSSGNTTITITASSDGLTDSEMFILTVTDPEDTSPPTITPIENQEIRAGFSLTVRIVASDPDPHQTPTITYSPILPYATLTNNGDGTADLVFAPATNVPLGETNIIITATSDDMKDTKEFSLTITHPDPNPPVINSIGANPSIAIGETASVRVVASDLDLGDTPSFSLVNNNLDFITVNDIGNGTAIINIKPLASGDFFRLGDHTITVKVTSRNRSLEVDFTLTITGDDADGDKIADIFDVDDDNDGLIEINNLEELDDIRHNLAGTSYKINDTDTGNMNGAPESGLKGYELVRDLDFNDPASYASEMVNIVWTTGSGWLPIGDNSTFFTGILEGNGYTITNLMIRRNIRYIGLFGRIGTTGQVRNLGIENGVAVHTGNSGNENYIGLLAGQSDGTIIAVRTSGIANDGNGNDDSFGGLVGENNGTITACHTTGNANGGDGTDNNFGGLVGENNGTITACYATGNANGGKGMGNSFGGLVGENNGTITACYATGNANGGKGMDNSFGGLVGLNNGTITACHATGNANGGDGSFAGGLVGENKGGTITACYATGNADGGEGNSDNVGGLVGRNDRGTITACYATGNANGGDGRDFVGGLAGISNFGTITACYGFGTVTGETPGVDRSSDASTTVGSPSGLTMTNSSAMEANRWPARVWDFGTDSQVPVLKWITGYDNSGATEEAKYPCDPALLPAGQECGEIIPGQER